MGPLDALWHLLNFLLAPLGVAAIAAGLVKLAWWRALRGRAWADLAGPAAVAGVVAQVLGLMWHGRDGRMATYLLLVVVVAAVLGWRAFGPRPPGPGGGA